MPDDFAPVPAGAMAAPAPSSGSSAALLDAEKLHVYRLAVEFQTLAAWLVPRQRGVLLATLRDQLDRASVSVVLNIAEGAGRFSPPDKARFYAIARGSATECGAILDLLLARCLVNEALHAQARTLLDRPQYRLRVDEVRVFYDVPENTVQVLAIVSKAQADAWLKAQGTPSKTGGTREGEG